MKEPRGDIDTAAIYRKVYWKNRLISVKSSYDDNLSYARIIPREVVYAEGLFVNAESISGRFLGW